MPYFVKNAINKQTNKQTNKQMWCWATNRRCVCFLSLRWSSRLIFDIMKNTWKLFQDIRMERYNKNLAGTFICIVLNNHNNFHSSKMSRSLILSVSISLSSPVFDNLSHNVHCGNALWKNYALWKTSPKKKCVKFGTKSTHFENFFQSVLNLGPRLRTLKKKFKVRYECTSTFL